MSDETRTVTEREAVLRERIASAKARCAALFAARTGGACASLGHAGYLTADNPCDACREEAVRRHPRPKVVRPRVVTDQCGLRYRLVNGELQGQYDDSGRWTTALIVGVRSLPLVVDLFNNPTEMVEAES